MLKSIKMPKNPSEKPEETQILPSFSGYLNYDEMLN